MPNFHLSRSQARQLDQRASEEFGMPTLLLMENAGRGAAELLLRLNPDQRRVLMLCGPGNNGGDGFVVARHLQNRGNEVDVLLVALEEKLSPDARINAEIWKHTGPLWTVNPGQPLDVEIQGILDGAPGWIVDALFGTGLQRSLIGPYAEIVERLNVRKRPVLALDIPSGLDADTGEPLGPTIRATHTATFVAPKLGFSNPTSQAWTGEVHTIDIGAPKALLLNVERGTRNAEQKT
jgi:NAD(P)H-hydrate epimerase